jgi:hypothetical protein
MSQREGLPAKTIKQHQYYFWRVVIPPYGKTDISSIQGASEI